MEKIVNWVWWAASLGFLICWLVTFVQMEHGDPSTTTWIVGCVFIGIYFLCLAAKRFIKPSPKE